MSYQYEGVKREKMDCPGFIGRVTHRKIIFVYPPASIKGRYSEVSTGVECYPEGLCILASVARNSGCEAQLFDARLHKQDFDRIAEKLIEQEPDYIGLTASTMLISPAGLLARKIKEKKSSIQTIVGGPHITALPQETMKKFPAFDYAVIGEGEVTLSELLGALAEGDPLSAVKGIIFRKNGNLIKTELRPYIEDMDTIPFPAWDLVPNLAWDYQQSVARIDRLPAISMVFSRGCPFQCTFCARNVFGNHYRTYSIERIIQMIKCAKETFGIRSVAIEDEIFMVSKNRTKELCNTLIEEDLDITWSCAGRVDTVDEELLALMRRAGCWSISYGIESGSGEILKNVKKRITVDQIRRCLTFTKNAGIETKGYFIIGLPGETRDTIQETIDFIKNIDLDIFQMSYLNAFPGTEISREAHKWGSFKDDWDNMNIWTPNFIPTGLTKEILEKESKRAFREFYFRPKIIIKMLLRTFKSRSYYKYLKDGFKIIKFLIKK